MIYLSTFFLDIKYEALHAPRDNFLTFLKLCNFGGVKHAPGLRILVLMAFRYLVLLISHLKNSPLKLMIAN